MKIPKIVHHIAPENTKDWHPIWQECDRSWQKHFPDFEHMYWDDEDLDELIQNFFEQYHISYTKFPKKIIKYDFARMCLLYTYGGIYTDMDVFCYQNFYDQLMNDICLLGDVHSDRWYNSGQISHVTIVNCLMCAVPGQIFWIKCIEKMINLFDYYENKKIFQTGSDLYANSQNHMQQLAAHAVLDMGSCNIASIINDDLDTYIQKIQFLPSFLYDSDYLEYKPEFFTKHLYTGTWDQLYVDCTNKKQFANEHYKMLRNVDIDFIKKNILR